MKRRVQCVLLAIVVAAGVSVAITYRIFRGAAYRGAEPVTLYLRPGDNLSDKLQQAGVRTAGLRVLGKVFHFRQRPGKYVIFPGEDIITIFRRLRNGHQDPVRLVLPGLRTMPDMAGFLARKLMMDSAQVARAFADTSFVQTYGYTPETLPALFVPNTYEVYWNVSLPDLLHRLQREHDIFWNTDRLALCESIGLTPVEVATLASIVDEETAVDAEKPDVAGMYLNRMAISMPLQADPTVKFAVGDFTLRRIMKKHTEVDCPYNTYIYKGLPPGPIRVASIAGIDAVLHHTKHNYLYMCAKEDFSGTHNFASNFNEHLRNARNYQRALNEKGVK